MKGAAGRPPDCDQSAGLPERDMAVRPLLVAAILLAFPWSAAAQPAACPQFSPGGHLPVLLNPKLEQRATVLCNDGYAVAASGVTHGTLWSAEHLTAADLAAARDTPRAGAFHPDSRLPYDDQAQLGDYRRSGYDRGHMTPSGDMPNAAAQAQSFSLANVVPQTAALNRGVWEGVETAVRDLAVRVGDVFVVTGPAFLGSELQAIGTGVLVPTSTWKAVYDPHAGGTGVYVCQNTAQPRCAVVSVAALISVVGIDPFPGLPAGIKATAMTLPEPETTAYARRRRRFPALLDGLLGRVETP